MTAKKKIEYSPRQKYVEVDITSAEIGTLGSVGVTLLPQPGANKYYDIDKIIFEFEHNTTAYTIADSYFYITQSSDIAYFTTALIQTPENNVLIIKTPESTNSDGIESITYGWNMTLNNSVVMTTYDGGDPTLGDGTLKAKIWYTIKTFG